jgi:hypothetical protein
MSLYCRLGAAVAVAMLLPVATAEAQLRGGVKSGIGQALYTGEHEFEWRTAGPNTSLFVNWASGQRTSQQLEIGDSHRLGVSTTGGSVLTFTATYLDISLLTRFALPRTLFVEPYVMAGPSLVYGLSCNLEFITGSFISSTPCDEEAGSNRLDIGFTAATGLRIPVGPTHVFAEARGSTSFRSVVVPLESQASRSFSWSVLGGLSMPMEFGRARRAPGVPSGVVAAATVVPTAPGLPPLAPISGGVITEAPVSSELAPASTAKRVSLTAVDADARSLLIAIAGEAGVNMVVSNDVRQRVSVSFKDATADEAIRAIIAQAGLTIVDPPSARALPTVVYYQLPLNVNDAPVESIAARFGVSAELARWLAENRTSPRQDEQQR